MGRMEQQVLPGQFGRRHGIPGAGAEKVAEKTPEEPAAAASGDPGWTFF